MCPQGPDTSEWRACGYEPIMLGSYLVDDSSPSIGGSWGSEHTSVVELRPGVNSRLFSGVESLNGPDLEFAWGEPQPFDFADEQRAFELSRYPSKLLPDAIVQAEWRSPNARSLVPCVVEHPRHAVFSIFFWGDPSHFLGGWLGRDGIGSDDRLRLVVNSLLVMSWKSRAIMAAGV
mmetsp:Transcript_172081/g.546204  ORF Transcript_172081/g.546204 Transcript_172081/m.546204 type:complete len:176 (-) Transcript_172081:86-613(-)